MFFNLTALIFKIVDGRYINYVKNVILVKF